MERRPETGPFLRRRFSPFFHARFSVRNQPGGSAAADAEQSAPDAERQSGLSGVFLVDDPERQAVPSGSICLYRKQDRGALRSALFSEDERRNLRVGSGRLRRLAAVCRLRLRSRPETTLSISRSPRTIFPTGWRRRECSSTCLRSISSILTNPLSEREQTGAEDAGQVGSIL